MSEHLVAAIAAQDDTAVRPPILKLGHLDARFNVPLNEDGTPMDGQPSFGKIENLQLSENGMTLLGDLVGIPSWLDDALPSAFPRRSIEGVTGRFRASAPPRRAERRWGPPYHGGQSRPPWLRGHPGSYAAMNRFRATLSKQVNGWSALLASSQPVDVGSRRRIVAQPAQRMVTVFIYRETIRRPEVLLVWHAGGGLQVPAGSVEPKESLEQAALREGREETGVADVEVVEAFVTETGTWPGQERW